MTKASERIVKSPYDGKEITDSSGRVIRLRKPSILDTLDLIGALGDFSNNPSYLAMCFTTLYVGLLDGQVFETPKTYKEVRAALQRLDEHGMSAVNEAIADLQSSNNEKEAIDNVKK
jgi:hypothetical protein